MNILFSGMFLAQSMRTSPSQTGFAILPALCIGIFALAVIGFMLFVWGTIFKKAGYSPWFAVLMIIPIANIVWILIFAFSKWPIHQELEALRGGRGFTGGFPVIPPR